MDDRKNGCNIILIVYNTTGMWMPILNFLNIAGVVSNAFLIAFTSSFSTFVNIQTGSDRALWIVVAFEVSICMQYLTIKNDYGFRLMVPVILIKYSYCYFCQSIF